MKKEEEVSDEEMNNVSEMKHVQIIDGRVEDLYSSNAKISKRKSIKHKVVVGK